MWELVEQDHNMSIIGPGITSQPRAMAVACLLLVVGAVTMVSAQVSDYCGISRKHTMCRNKGLGPLCGKPLGQGMSVSDQQEVVDYHNR